MFIKRQNEHQNDNDILKYVKGIDKRIMLSISDIKYMPTDYQKLALVCMHDNNYNLQINHNNGQLNKMMQYVQFTNGLEKIMNRPNIIVSREILFTILTSICLSLSEKNLISIVNNNSNGDNNDNYSDSNNDNYSIYICL